MEGHSSSTSSPQSHSGQLACSFGSPSISSSAPLPAKISVYSHFSHPPQSYLCTHILYLNHVNAFMLSGSCISASPAHMNDLCTCTTRCDVGWCSGCVLRLFGGVCPLGDRTVPSFHRASRTATSPVRPLNRS